MTQVADPIAWPIVNGLAECLCEILDKEAPVKCCCVQYGSEVSLDDCSREGDREGMAWARLVSVYPTRVFPQADATRIGNCGGENGWAVMVELGVVRCAPSIDERGNLPKCWDITNAAEKAANDAHAMRRAIMCCGWGQNNDPLGDDPEYVIGAWHPLGGEGGCQGGTMTVTVHAWGCVCNG
ncbi:hypothetical protein [Amycolatopsis sp. DSM 110486]|uniref:hypothetical protein n=1 Tax=Amycolatopsis sp. DSM 110486 TaxID=2865832 RepID=UPI001C69CAFF|nr:hypothetical protein [Amycolatopsis sp. DSM 110486]QYN17610.1 hypothetical protein K1T34_33025 [Amycolatopsis sp. DSM 110486]